MKNLLTPSEGLQVSCDVPVSGSPAPGRIHLFSSFRWPVFFFLLFCRILGGVAFESDPPPNSNPSTPTTSTPTIRPSSSRLPPSEERQPLSPLEARLREIRRMAPARHYLRVLRAHPYIGGRTETIRPPSNPHSSLPHMLPRPVQRPRGLSPLATTPRHEPDDSEGDQVVPDISNSPPSQVTSTTRKPSSSSLPANIPSVLPPSQAQTTPPSFSVRRRRPDDIPHPGARPDRPLTSSTTTTSSSSGSSAGPVAPPPRSSFPEGQFPPFLFPPPVNPTSSSRPSTPSERIPGAGGAPQHIPFYVMAARIMNRSPLRGFRSTTAPLVVSGTPAAPTPENAPQLYALPYGSLNIVRTDDPSSSQVVPSEAVIAQGQAHLHVSAGGDPRNSREGRGTHLGFPILVTTSQGTISRHFDRAVPDILPAEPSDAPSPDDIIPPPDMD
ncbi:hypothetical protein CSUI_002458 [Cystoisospora suis]|uniref:Uncharacterized protein n=1 Tax=Cystoisospora suis TaxID=483139 RepID=A0A2C6L8U8_9APIC|nr:hypothetical protein CSUI_002458 [Cystoisospora suis]